MPAPVLLVADDLAIIAAVKRALGREGYETILATSAADAIIAWGHHLPGLVLVQPSVESDRGHVVLEALQAHPDARLARVILLGETIPGFALQVEPLPLDVTHFAQTVEASLRGGPQSEGWSLVAAPRGPESPQADAGLHPRASADAWRATAPPETSAGASTVSSSAPPRPVAPPPPSAGLSSLPIVDATPSLSPPMPVPTAPLDAPPDEPRTPPPPPPSWRAPEVPARVTPPGALGPTRTLVTPLPAAAPLGLFERMARVTPPPHSPPFAARAPAAAPPPGPDDAPSPRESAPGDEGRASTDAALEHARAAADAIRSTASEAQAQRERDLAAARAELAEALEETRRERAFRTKAELDAARLGVALESARETLRQSVVDWRTAVEATRRESEAEAAARLSELQRRLEELERLASERDGLAGDMARALQARLTLEDGLAGAQRLLAAERGQRAAAEAALEAERSSREEAQRLLARSRDTLAGALQELEAVRTEQAQERSLLDAARSELEATATSLASARSEADDVRVKLVTAEAEAAERVALVERERDAVRKELAAETERAEALEARLRELEAERQSERQSGRAASAAPLPAPARPASAEPEVGRGELERLEVAYRDAQAADYFRILGLPRTAGTEEVHRARARLAAEFDPARFARCAGGGALERARVLTSLVEEAARALSDERRRAEYARHLSE